MSISRKSLKLGYEYGDYYHSLGEIGKELGITRERARQIQNIALHKFKLGMERKGYKLSDFL